MPNSAVPTDSDVVAVGVRRDGGVGEVSARRDGRDHRDRHALADPPLRSVGRRCPVAGRQRILSQVEALVEPVAAERQIVVGHVRIGERIARHDDVAAAQVERVDAEPGRQFVQADSTAKIICPRPYPRNAPDGMLLVYTDSASTRLFAHRYTDIDSLHPWNITPGLWLPYAPASIRTSTASAVSTPSAPAATVTSTRNGWRHGAATNSSVRLNS